MSNHPLKKHRFHSTPKNSKPQNSWDFFTKKNTESHRSSLGISQADECSKFYAMAANRFLQKELEKKPIDEISEDYDEWECEENNEQDDIKYSNERYVYTKNEDGKLQRYLIIDDATYTAYVWASILEEREKFRRLFSNDTNSDDENEDDGDQNEEE